MSANRVDDFDNGIGPAGRTSATRDSRGWHLDQHGSCFIGVVAIDDEGHIHAAQ
jgi:hypothetical protein